MDKCASQAPRNSFISPESAGPEDQSKSLTRVLPAEAQTATSSGALLDSQEGPAIPRLHEEHIGGRMPNQLLRSEAQHTVLVAERSYEKRVHRDLSFRRGDIMYLLDASNSDWWYVRHANRLVGFIPQNMVAKLRPIESEEWYAGSIGRAGATHLVATSNLPKGTFLIRKREANSRELALTIRGSADGSSVKHYKIKRLNGEDGDYYMTTRRTFVTLTHLVRHYSEAAHGLCCQLTFPAPLIIATRYDSSQEAETQWEIPRDQLELKRKLGIGDIGEVWYGKWRGTVDVAVKTVKSDFMTPEILLREVKTIKHWIHPNLVTLYGVCAEGEPLYVITEFMSNGSLLHYLRRERNGKKDVQLFPTRALRRAQSYITTLSRHFSHGGNLSQVRRSGSEERLSRGENALTLQVLVHICAQVANGMVYLEERKLLHRDLRARNVFVGEKISGKPAVKVQIADVELVRKLSDQSDISMFGVGSPSCKWTAPEAVSCGTHTAKSDVWSYGILLYEIMTMGRAPYSGMSKQQALEQVERGYRMPCPSECPEEIYEVMLQCWDRQPDQRPTFKYLFHFFDEYFGDTQPRYVPLPC